MAAITGAALAISFQYVLMFAMQDSAGDPDFWTSANVVVDADARARASGISPGDRIDYPLMPMEERYGSHNDGLRVAPAGKSQRYIVERHGKGRTVALTAHSLQALPHGLNTESLTEFGSFLLFALAMNVIFLVLLLLASALALIKPTGLTVSLLLFVAQYGALMPAMYSFLPAREFAAVMVTSDLLAGLGPVGFLGLALYLDPRRRVRPQQIIGTGALLLAIITVPLAVSDVSQLMVGARPQWPLAGWVSFSAVLLCYAAGIVLLLQLAASATTPRILRLLAVLLATIGVMILFGRASVIYNSWYFANLPTAVLNRVLIEDRWDIPLWWAILYIAFVPLKPLASLVAFYLIVRSKIVDTGPVLSRMIAYVIVVLLVVVVFAIVNIDLAFGFSGYAVLVPFEIFAALAIGYWVSGLRDLAGCLSLTSVDAWSLWAKGHPGEERDALMHALRLAERTRRQGFIAEVRAHLAFSSWRDGDDAEFERNAETLARVVGKRNLRGLRGFAFAARGDDDALSFKDDDFLEWKARAALVRCARSDDAVSAQHYAVEALAIADSAGLASLQVLSAVAVAETSPDQRLASLERAHTIARDAGWPALSKSLLALRANARDIGILEPFVEIRLRKSKPLRPMFEISFFNAELRQIGTRIPLAENELELLLAVAFAPSGLKDTELIDELWPESDGDAARNAFRVCLHRLRKKAGDARIVTRVGKGYVVHPWADVDLWRLQTFVTTCRDSGGRDGVLELRELCDALRAGEGRRARLGEWFYRFEQVLARKLAEAEQLLDGARTRRA